MKKWRYLGYAALAIAALGGGLMAGQLMRPSGAGSDGGGPQGALLTAPSGNQYRAYTGLALGTGEDFTLESASGGTRSLRDFDGAVKLVFFGYTNCPDVCPTTLLAMRQVEASLEQEFGPLDDRFQGIFVSVDPGRDTPERLTRYVRHFDEDFVALSGTDEQVAEAARLFDVRYQLHEPDAQGNYLVDHTTLGFLLGPRGRVWAVYPGAGDWQSMHEGARDLLAVDWSVSG